MNRSRAGRLAEWLNRGISTASGLLGSVGSGVGSAAEGLAGSGWGSARDASFQRAIKAAEGHFNRCARCACYVCGRCWHPEQGLCFSCAPDTEGEAMAAQQRGLNDLAMQQAYDEGQRRGQEYDARTARQLVCPQCRTETHGGRFCPGCGFELAQQRPCAGCRVPMRRTPHPGSVRSRRRSNGPRRGLRTRRRVSQAHGDEPRVRGGAQWRHTPPIVQRSASTGRS